MRFVQVRALRVLDFDIENRPLSYLGQDFTTADITAIACSWVGDKTVNCWLLGEVSGEEMLGRFVEFYNQADVVTGHYIRKHDLPLVSGGLIECGQKPLGSKLSSDTKLDLVKRSGISASQENLAAMFGLPEPKQGMNQIDWRAANRLTKEGLVKTRQRVTADVIQHKALRGRLIDAGLLSPPRMWWAA